MGFILTLAASIIETHKGKSTNMGARQNAWAKRRRQQLIELLGGCCQHCGRTRKLEIEHIDGCTWADRRSKLSPPQRVTIYWREYENGTPLTVLCRRCNARKGTQTRDAGMRLVRLDKSRETDQERQRLLFQMRPTVQPRGTLDVESLPF